MRSFSFSFVNLFLFLFVAETAIMAQEKERFTQSKEALLNDLLVSYKLIKTQLMMMRMIIIMMMIRIYIIDDLQRLSIIYIQ